MPTKPWQTSQTAGVASPLGSSTAQDGQPKPWETATTLTAGDGPEPATQERPWARPDETINPATSRSAIQPYTSSPYGTSAYGTNSYGTGYTTFGTGPGAYGGSSLYSQPVGPYSSMYNSGYGYGGGYGGSMYGQGYRGCLYGGGGMYGSGSMYGTSGMSPYGGYSTGSMYGSRSMYGGPPGAPPGLPPGLPPPHPGQRSKWQIFMDMTHNLMHFFGRVSFLMDENAHAVHFFITALLQLLERASFLWAEVARFVLRILGYKRPLTKGEQQLSVQSGVKGGSEPPKLLEPSRVPSRQGLTAASPVLEAVWGS